MNQFTGSSMDIDDSNDAKTYIELKCPPLFGDLDLDLDEPEAYPLGDLGLDPPVVVQTEQENTDTKARSSGIVCRLKRKLIEEHGDDEKIYTWSFELLEFGNDDHEAEVKNLLSTDEATASIETKDEFDYLQPEEIDICKHELITDTYVLDDTCKLEPNTDNHVSDVLVPKIPSNVLGKLSKEAKTKTEKATKRSRAKSKETLNNSNQFLKQGFINTVNRYRCKRCDFSCRLGSDLILHIQKKHKENVGPYKCSECGSTTKNLVQHMRVLHSNLGQTYKCEQCNYTTRVKGKLALHMRIAHKIRSGIIKSSKTDDTVETCKELVSSSEAPSVIQTTVVDEASIQPKPCKKSVKRVRKAQPKKPKDKPVLPVRKKRGGADKHKCPQCDYATRWKKNLLRHVMTKHDNDHSNVYKCQECDYVAKIKANLTQHVRVKHDVSAAVHKCTECEYMTKLRKNLLRHVRVMHDATADVYRCSKCDYVTKVKRRLQEHTSVKHVTKEGTYKCGDCPYATDIQEDFLTHVKIMHTGESRLHKCDDCEYTTKWRKNLLRHVRLLHDANAKVYECTSCDYTTKVEKTFAIHVQKRHRKERDEEYMLAEGEDDVDIDDGWKTLKSEREAYSPMFKCAQCDYETKWKKNLPRHVKSKHKRISESRNGGTVEQTER